jgi:hypothetical protein
MVTTDLAQPCEQRRAAAKRPEAAHGIDHGDLHHIFETRGVQRAPSRRERGKPRGEGVEKLIEGSLFTTTHPVNEVLLIQH